MTTAMIAKLKHKLEFEIGECVKILIPKLINLVQIGLYFHVEFIIIIHLNVILDAGELV